MNRQERKAPKSVLDHLKEAGTIDRQTTLDEAVEIMTDELNCEECIAVEQCAHNYGMKSEDDTPECKTTVRAFLSQDYIKRDKEEK